MRKHILYISLIAIVVIFGSSFVRMDKKAPETAPAVAVSATYPVISTSSVPSAPVSPSISRISLVAGTFSRTIDVPDGISVYDAMKLAASTTPFDFKATYYSGLGYFVEQIGGVKNSGGTYWTLYVNGEYSMVGASDRRIRSGDRVEWKFEKR